MIAVGGCVAPGHYHNYHGADDACGYGNASPCGICLSNMAGVVLGAANVLGSFLIAPFAVLLALSLVLASFGKSLGIRRNYVAILLKIFEYGRIKIEKASQRRRADEEDRRASQPINGISPSSSLISREGVKLVPEPKREHFECGDELQRNGEFHLDDPMVLVKAGVEAIIDDEVTKCFSAEELPSWNLLTRTNNNYHHISLRLTIIWCFGFLFRYTILLPFRLLLLTFGVGWLCLCTAFIGYLPNGRFKKWLNWHVSLMCFRILSRAFSAIITYHNRENRAQGGGICVANHTSPIDVVVLACDNCYALIGQSHGGFFGLLQRALTRASNHIWFERSEIKDRSAVTKRLQEHVEDKNKLPILIFPEGTCINNTSVMMFKKGSFEIGGTIYPAAIKYDPKFGDPFWDSSKQGAIHYLLMMMTSWAIVCEVWYLPPMVIQEGEEAVDFANRVKAEIAKRGGLVDLTWDGQLKRTKAKKEWLEKQQEVFSQRLKFE